MMCEIVVLVVLVNTVFNTVQSLKMTAKPPFCVPFGGSLISMLSY
jgi:hypothetical protein